MDEQTERGFLVVNKEGITMKSVEKGIWINKIKGDTYEVLDKELKSKEAVKIREKIKEERERDPEKGLFNLIQDELRKLVENPNEEIEKGLKDARQVIINAAKEAGALKTAKELLREAQTTDNWELAEDTVQRINTGSLEEQATKFIENSSSDFAGMNIEYVRIGRLNMDLAKLSAKGEGKSTEAAKKQREIEVLGWGNPPLNLVDQAKDYLERKRKEGAPKEIEALIPIEGTLTPEEEEELYLIEKDILKHFLSEEDYMGKAVRIVAYNRSTYPYDTRATLEPALEGMKGLNNRINRQVEETIKELGDKPSARLERIKTEFDKIREWLDGNRALLESTPSTLLYFWDGLLMMQRAVMETREAIPVITPELHKMFTAPGEGEWRLGKEIVEKQDQAFAILRGIAAAHRHPGRNMGRPIIPQSRHKIELKEGEDAKGREVVEVKENGVTKKFVIFRDYPVTPKQIEFIEKFFGYDPENDKATEEDINIETLRITSTDELMKQIREFFTDPNNKGKKFKIAAGQEYALTKKNLGKIASHAESLKEKDEQGKDKIVGKIWVQGVHWEPNSKTYAELEKRTGVGDSVFVGKEILIDEGETSRIDSIIGKNQVGVIKKTPKAILNPFVMQRTPERIDKVNKMLVTMLKVGRDEHGRPGRTSLWERLKDDKADAKALYDEFDKELKKLDGQKIDVLDKHIIDMARISLLYFLEGANLGWGFEYKHEEDDKKLGKGGDKRVVASGGTDACTDIITFFNWLMTEGSNNWKWWSHGTLPLGAADILSINEHEPGWAPNLDKEGRWTIYYKGRPLTIKAPPRFEMTYLDSASVIHGEKRKDKAMALMLSGSQMSDLPWLRFLERSPYRWKVSLGQTWYEALMLSGLPTREIQEKFMGETQEVPRTIELEQVAKRLTLGMRDMQKQKDVEEFMSLTTSLFHSWRENMLPSSPQPGEFDPYKVGRLSRRGAIALRKYAPEGDAEVGERVAEQFLLYDKQLMDIGLLVGKEADRAELGFH